MTTDMDETAGDDVTEGEPTTAMATEDEPTNNLVDDPFRAWEEATARRYTDLRHDARAIFRAMEGWGLVKDQDAWVQTCQESAEQFQTGAFLIDRLGAERYLDPPLMATLLGLRRRLTREFGADTAAEWMLIDLAV